MQTWFQITPEGSILVRNGATIYRDTLANFTADHGSAPPALPQGALQQLYEPGKRHFYADADGVVGGGDMSWAWGDAVIAACDDLLVAQAERLSPPEPTAEQAAAALCDQVNVLRDQRLAAGFADEETGKTWQCDQASIGKWTALGASAGLAIVMALDPPPSFPLIAADNSVVTLAAGDVYALLNGRVMPWVSANVLYARAMKDAILAGNAPADITAGWP